MGGLVPAAFGTDFSIERTGENGGQFISGTATSGTARTLVDTSQTMTPDRYANYQLRIISGTGMGQRKRITQNTATTFWTESNWNVNPDATSVYAVYGNTERLYLVGNGSSSIYKYNTEQDQWFQGNSIDFGQSINIGIKYAGQDSYAMSTGVRNTGGILTVTAAPVAGGSGYVVGEIITLATGAGGKVRVTSVNAGVVTGVELYACGSGYSVTTFAQSATSGSGSGCTVAVASVGVVGRITSVQNMNLARGDSITIYGCSESAWNTTYSILGIDSLTTFDIALTATANAAASNSQSTSVMVDATKNWTVNEHIGKLVSISVAGTSPTHQIRRITANTATTLTLQSVLGSAAVNGTSRYTLHQPQAFGRDEQFKVIAQNGNSKATGGSTTTLIDSTKNWASNQWVGYKFRVTSGTGVGSEIAVTANTATTLTFATQSFTPDTTTDYIMMDTFGLATAASNTTNATITDTTKNWTVNQWAGKRLRLTSGAGQCQEITITSNTATVITCAGVFANAPGTDTTYTILGIPVRSTGIEANWIFGNTDPATKGKYLFVPRGGGSNIIDRYDITNEMWDFTPFFSPQTETLSTGTMWAYNGADKIYFTVNATGRVASLDVNTFKIQSAGLTPYAHGTALISNRMEITKTPDGLYFLYIFRHSGQELWRSLVFWE